MRVFDCANSDGGHMDGTIGAAIASLKTAGEIAHSFLKARDIATIQGKVIELQSVILSAQSSALSAQSEQSALLDAKRELEQKIADLEAWEREKTRYLLEEVVSGAFAYALKPDAAGAEPPHKICANCYQHRKKSILMEFQIPQGKATGLRCHPCGAEIILRGTDLRSTNFRPLR